MRLDLALCRLRFVKTRSAARTLVEAGHLRVSGQRARLASHPISIGDVLTIPRAKSVIVVEIEALPERRGPAEEARQCYRVLDPREQTALAEGSTLEFKGKRSP